MHTSASLSIRLALAAYICAVFLSGCALTPEQKAAGAKFATATQTLGNLAADEFKNSRDDVVEMRALLKELGDPNIDTPDGQLTLERAAIRVEASRTLARYGELLSNLVSADQTDALRQSSDSLMQSLGNIGGVRLTADVSGAVSAAISSIAGMFIKNKRKKAVKAIVVAMQTPIAQLLTTMKSTFDENSPQWAGHYKDTVSDLRQIDITVANLSSQQVNRAAALAAQKEQRFEAITPRIVEAIDNVQIAHVDLMEELANDEFVMSNLDGFVAQVRELAEIYEILENQ